ncbi:MAG: hypothetical protein KatS3mg068_0436 [Candidatus Sericytochromatia bacterium]|nr:MAG: hypothetical protein KatS3mg068_0436 [Candidatus Sericytochromatia bacterium]
MITDIKTAGTLKVEYENMEEPLLIQIQDKPGNIELDVKLSEIIFNTNESNSNKSNNIKKINNLENYKSFSKNNSSNINKTEKNKFIKHKVTKNETYFSIYRKYYGNNFKFIKKFLKYFKNKKLKANSIILVPSKDLLK